MSSEEEGEKESRGALWRERAGPQGLYLVGLWNELRAKVKETVPDHQQAEFLAKVEEAVPDHKQADFLSAVVEALASGESPDEILRELVAGEADV